MKNGYSRLAAAVVGRTLDDLKDFNDRLNARPCETACESIAQEINNLNRFIGSDWFEMLCYLGDLDPDLMREKAVEVQSDK